MHLKHLARDSQNSSQRCASQQTSLQSSLHFPGPCLNYSKAGAATPLPSWASTEAGW
jgi:hypothetical protein